MRTGKCLSRKEIMKHLGISVTPKVERAMRYLEGHGQRFLVDFGTENAVDKARALAEETVRYNEMLSDRRINALLDRHIAYEVCGRYWRIRVSQEPQHG